MGTGGGSLGDQDEEGDIARVPGGFFRKVRIGSFLFFRKNLQDGLLPVISGVITPKSRVVLCNPIYPFIRQFMGAHNSTILYL